MFTEKQSQQTPYPFLDSIITNSWLKIAPFWPLESLVSVNPMLGFEKTNFQEALQQANVFFQSNIPSSLENLNRETIKWLQAYFDDTQATIQMPFKEDGLLHSVLKLIVHDSKFREHKLWLTEIQKRPTQDIINQCLHLTQISENEYQTYLTLLLTSLSGWSSYAKYQANYNQKPSLEKDYLALRLVFARALCTPLDILNWYRSNLNSSDIQSTYSHIEKEEKHYQDALVKQLRLPAIKAHKTKIKAQVIFCIDVRSEPFRRALESTKKYKTYGFAGFFGVPISVKDSITGESFAACPVLIEPKKQVTNHCASNEKFKKSYENLSLWKSIYHFSKNTFTSPFSLAEALGINSGISIVVKNFFPSFHNYFYKDFTKSKNKSNTPDIRSIDLESQHAYALNFLKSINLTDSFASTVILCSHSSTTENNPLATSLNCGACGGREGITNAKVLASILNQPKIRELLKQDNIEIPSQTTFIAANHNTTTDEVDFFNANKNIKEIKKDFVFAQEKNIAFRMKQLQHKNKDIQHAKQISENWSEVRPEWGLARNAAFIIGPRDSTAHINFEGRAFLHSYDADKDANGTYLEQILTAPVIVAQWINSQYLFSTLDNCAFGAGSKVTSNITGKIGLMQGNASDLMTGISLQSVYSSDTKKYHRPIRLTVVTYAKPEIVLSIIEKHENLLSLVKNQWIHLMCKDTSKIVQLNSLLKWKPL